MAMETEEMVQILVIVFLLVIGVLATIFLLGDKGGSIIDSIRNFMRFGR